MSGEVSLQGWDTANVVTLDVLNDAIAAQNTTPPTFNLAEGPNTIKGKWGPWKVTPGRSGELIEVACPIVSGNGTDTMGASHDLKGMIVNVEVTLAKIPTDPNFKIKDTTSTTPKKEIPATVLKTNAQSTAQDPAVTIISIIPSNLRRDFLFIFEDWFNKHIADFGQIFHAALLNQKAAHGDFQWLKPTALSYSMVTTLDKNSIFAALCQTDGDPDGKLAHQIDPAAGSNIPKGSNSVLVISGEKFAEHILKTGAQHVMKGSKLSDFDIIGDGLVVTNNKELVWLDVKLDDGTVVSPKVPKGQMRMRIVEDQIEIEFTGMTYSHPLFVGNDIFTISFTQYLNIELKKNKNKHYVLAPTNKNPKDKNPKEIPNIKVCTVSVKPDKSAADFDKYMMIASIALAILPFGCTVFKAGKWVLATKFAAKVGSAFSKAASAGGAAAEIAIDAAEATTMTSDALAGTDNLAAAAAMAADAPVGAGISTLVNRLAMISGFWASMTTIGFAVNKLEQDGDLDVTDSPTMEGFAAAALGASQWPGAKDWALKDVKLAKSLLFYGELTTTKKGVLQNAIEETELMANTAKSEQDKRAK